MKKKGSHAVLKIYLDLEANMITNEVISIGMISETGKEFYSLIRPHTKLDHNIKLLTHISQEEADMAPTLEEVVYNVMHYLLTFNEPIQFLNYGKNDKSYLIASSSFTDSENVKKSLVLIANNCENIAKRIASHFHRDAINLRSAYLTMRLSSNEEPIQNHNALEDACMLKWIWENINDYTLPEGVTPVKVEKVNMKYGKRKKAAKIDASFKPNPKKILKGASSRTIHNKAILNCPAIADVKYNIPVKATRKGKTNEYMNIYCAVHLVYRKTKRSAEGIYNAMVSIYDALNTGTQLNGWIFETVEK